MKRLKLLVMVITSVAAMVAINVAVVDRYASATTEANNALGGPFLTGEDTLTSFKPINKTYTEISYAGNRTIFPLNTTSAATINATERGNLMFKVI